MGAARLLAKGWIAFCIFAGAHAIVRALMPGVSLTQAIEPKTIAVLLFGAMGVLFIAGYGLSSGHLLSRFRPAHFTPGFNEIVFIAFAILSFVVQVVPHHLSWGVLRALEAAMRFAAPGDRVLGDNLARCGIDGGRTFAAAAAWLLAFVLLGSAISRLRMSAALVRLERKRRIEPLGPSGLALALGAASVGGIQLLFVGTVFPLLPCGALSGILGAVLIGLAPLMLAYLIAAALICLLAANPEN